MATDPFLREVDEEYRREQIANLWRKFGGLILALAFIVVAGIGGWRYWQYSQLQRSEAAAMRFEDALQLSREQKSDEAEKAFAALAADGPPGYRLLARFRVAAETGQGDAEGGAKAFDALAADTTVEATLRDLARLRAATLRLAAGESGPAAAELERIATPTNPWRHSAREILGLAALKRGDFEAATRWFDQMAVDRETPQGLRGRLEIYTALAAGGPVTATP
ncbi:tetratricopeptide repeat protein [uncultured Enterovirga sp.]|uniref:tetratricopeptide repeat protein n=1 Tax=uncultured Enterovirga sp. TaxID=2026352 RepID=UPI0035C9D567